MTADPSQWFWTQNCGYYVTNFFESTSTVINIKNEETKTHVHIAMNNNDVNSERYGWKKIKLYHIKHGSYFGHFSIFHRQLNENIPGKVL